MIYNQIDNTELRKEIAAVVHQVIEDTIDSLISEKISRFVRENEQRAKELSLMERVVRVEEELKALREIESARFEAIEKRFESLQREMNARFEALHKEMNARFEAVEKRFTSLQWMMGLGFSFLTVLMGLLKFWH